MTPGQEANCDNIGILFFDLPDNNGMLSVFIRITSRIDIRIHKPYHFMIK